MSRPDHVRRDPDRQPTAAGVDLDLSDRIAAGGDALGHLPDGRVVFVEGALPGERVTVEVTEHRRDFARARTVTVRTPSPDRVTAPCPHRLRGCGGCGWQEIDPAAQRRLKEAVVVDALRRIGRVAEPVLAPTIVLPVTAYRTTVHLAVDPDGRPSYHRHRDGGAITVDSCLVAHPWISEALGGLRLPGRRRATVRVGVAGGERLVLVDGPSPGAASVPPGFVLAGAGAEGMVHEEVGGRRWRVSARAFFQPGPAAAAALAAAVDAAAGDAVGARSVIVDAYAGVGVLGGVLAARSGARLVAVESGRVAADDAEHNLADLDATVVTGEVGNWTGEAADLVIADPARPGLGRPGVRALVACRPARIVLVSCDPASLGRDVSLLHGAGYRLQTTQVIDAFAQTVHVETVSTFDRSSPTP